MNPTQRIIHAVEQYHGLNPGDLRKPYRDRYYAWPRQMAMYAIRLETGQSFPQIGRSLKRDHTTIIHGCRRFCERAAENAQHIHDLARVMGMVRGDVA